MTVEETKRIEITRRELEKISYLVRKTTDQIKVIRRDLFKMNRKGKRYSVSTPIVKV